MSKRFNKTTLFYKSYETLSIYMYFHLFSIVILRSDKTTAKKQTTHKTIETNQIRIAALEQGDYVVAVVLLFYVHGKHLRSCRDGQLT